MQWHHEFSHDIFLDLILSHGISKTRPTDYLGEAAGLNGVCPRTGANTASPCPRRPAPVTDIFGLLIFGSLEFIIRLLPYF